MQQKGDLDNNGRKLRDTTKGLDVALMISSTDDDQQH
jgi:hypothetical protein